MNHPKMLYKGTQQHFQHTIANDQDHEDELKESGWIEFDKLQEEQNHSVGSVGGDSGSSKQSGALAEKLAEELVEAEELLEAEQEAVKNLVDENTRLKGIIEKGSAENADLREQLTSFTSDVNAMKARIAELEPKSQLVPELAPFDYSELSVKELQSVLDEKQIKYLKNDNKATLLELLK